MPDNVICILPALAHFIPTRALGNRYHCYPIYYREEDQRLSCPETCPRSQPANSGAGNQTQVQLQNSLSRLPSEVVSTSHKKIPLKIPKVTTDIKLGHAVVTKMM